MRQTWQLNCDVLAVLRQLCYGSSARLLHALLAQLGQGSRRQALLITCCWKVRSGTGKQLKWNFNWLPFITSRVYFRHPAATLIGHALASASNPRAWGSQTQGFSQRPFEGSSSKTDYPELCWCFLSWLPAPQAGNHHPHSSGTGCVT